MNGIILNAVILMLNLALYTAYSKSTKKVNAGSLLDVLLFRKGVDFTLVELNKIAALGGLTLLSISYFVPLFNKLAGPFE
eukprot:Pgem_evm1s8090